MSYEKELIRFLRCVADHPHERSLLDELVKAMCQTNGHHCDNCAYSFGIKDASPLGICTGCMEDWSCSVEDLMTDDDVEDANLGLCPMWKELIDE